MRKPQILLRRLFLLPLCGCLILGAEAPPNEAHASKTGASGYLVADPIFDASYMSSEAKFEKRNLRDELAHCSRVITDRYKKNYNFFIFGDILSDVFGRVILASKGERIVAERDQGDAFILKGSTCQMSAPFFVLTQSTPYHDSSPSPYTGLLFNVRLSDNDVKRLMVDVLNRHATAFGGKQHFLQWLRSWYNLAHLPYNIPRPLPGTTIPNPVDGFTPLMNSVLKAYEAENPKSQ